MLTYFRLRFHNGVITVLELTNCTSYDQGRFQELANWKLPGDAIAYQLLHRSINQQVANVVAKNDANLALSPTLNYVSIESPFLYKDYIYRVSSNAVYKLGGEVENITRSNNYKGKHGRKRNPNEIDSETPDSLGRTAQQYVDDFLRTVLLPFLFQHLGLIFQKIRPDYMRYLLL
ncbi:hypothetical protein TNCV_1877471 [Trichonephila clavipes]|nr:hypothetical protein TNCV_1877471 [Trichonephila clavipes]